jgi:hypothetical protein
VAGAYPTGAQREPVVKDGYVTTGIENQGTETVLEKKCLMVKDNYIFCQMTFTKFYGPDRSLEQAFDITNVPSDVDAYFMIVYLNSSIDNRGAALSIGHIQTLDLYESELPELCCKQRHILPVLRRKGCHQLNRIKK